MCHYAIWSNHKSTRLGKLKKDMDMEFEIEMNLQ